MIRPLAILVAFATMLAGSAACTADEVFPVVHREPITVRVVDGTDGKPQPFVHLMLAAGYNRRDLDLGMWREEAVTDAAGEVQLSDTLRNLPWLRVEVVRRSFCATAGSAAWSVERIRLDGLSGVNRCGVATHPEQPGALTLFVKARKVRPAEGTRRQEADSPQAVPGEATAPAPPSPGPVPVPELTEAEIDQLLLQQN